MIRQLTLDRMNDSLKIGLVFIVLLIQMNVSGQDQKQMPRTNTSSQEEAKADTTENPIMHIISAHHQLYDATGEDERFISYGNVIIKHGDINMFCDTAVLVNGVNLEADGKVIVIKNDSIKIFSESLLYLSESLMAYFEDNVILDIENLQLFTSFLQYDLEKNWAIYTDTALLVTENMKIKSKRGIFHLDEDYVNFYERVTIEGEDFTLLSDSLRYYTELEKAVFLSPTLINKNGKKIYSEGGYYDMKNQRLVLFGNAQFIDGDKTYSADTIFNDEKNNITRLEGNANYKSSGELGKAATIIYNSNTEKIELIGNAYFKNPENEATGDKISFFIESNDVKISGRSVLSNPPILISADNLDYKKEKGIAIADGNVILQDTSSNFEIRCDHARYIDSTDYIRAYNDTGKPLLINEVKADDTLYLSGDTLISYTVVEGLDTFRFFQAFNHVEMINSGMQSVCDSLSYNGAKDFFELYGNPVLWADSSQYSGDTIVIQMKDDEIDQVNIKENSMLLSTTDFQFYDQVKGKDIDTFFEDGNILKMSVTGGSQSVYYMKDEEDAYMGVNESKCTDMMFLFEDGELLQIRYYKEPLTKLTPMEKADHESIKFPGFSWQMNRRPITMSDLYN